MARCTQIGCVSRNIIAEWEIGGDGGSKRDMTRILSEIGGEWGRENEMRWWGSKPLKLVESGDGHGNCCVLCAILATMECLVYAPMKAITNKRGHSAGFQSDRARQSRCPLWVCMGRSTAWEMPAPRIFLAGVTQYLQVHRHKIYWVSPRPRPLHPRLSRLRCIARTSVGPARDTLSEP